MSRGRRAVDVVEACRRMSGRTPACMKAVPAFGGDDLVRSQPAAVFAARAERVDVLDEARRVARQPRLARGRGVARRRAALHQLDVVVERALPPSLRSGVRERGVGRRRDVAELVRGGSSTSWLPSSASTRPPARRASSSSRISRSSALAHLGAAVEDVARLHEDRRPAGPLLLAHRSGRPSAGSRRTDRTRRARRRWRRRAARLRLRRPASAVAAAGGDERRRQQQGQCSGSDGRRG